jgi:hypothetical protein
MGRIVQQRPPPSSGAAAAAATKPATAPAPAAAAEPQILRYSSVAFEVLRPARGRLTVPLLAPPVVPPDVAEVGSAFVLAVDGSAQLPRADKPASAAAGAAGATTFDVWYPQGSGGGFFNRGLAQWHQQRAAWLARPPGYVHPPYPPEAEDVDIDDLIEDLIDVEPFELPASMRLPDVIDLYQEAWSPVSQSSDDW